MHSIINGSTELNEQIDIECQKTANYLLYALENDKRLFCRVNYEGEMVKVSCLIWNELSEQKDDHGWSFSCDRKKPIEISNTCKKIAEAIARYSEKRFMVREEKEGIYQLIITSAGESTLHGNIISRARFWQNRFLKNADVKDWCINRIFVDGFPPKITVTLDKIETEKTVVVYDDENYDDLQLKEQVYGMALCIAEYGMGKYDLKLLYNEKGPFVELHFFEEKKRKTW